MTDYRDKVAEVIDSDDLFANTISFSEESIQIDFMRRSDQSNNVVFGHTAIVMVSDDERLDAFEQFQEIARILVRDAEVEKRLGNESKR